MSSGLQKNFRRSCETGRHEINAAEGYFLRKRNSVPIAVMAWLSNT
jgi:hypothetical protein